jgi:hypothetical protein
MGLGKIFKSRKSSGSTATSSSLSSTSEVKPGDLPMQRARNQKITPQELRELRELIQYRYSLDIELWGYKKARPFMRDKIQEKMRSADAALMKIERTVVEWDKREYFETDAEYEKLRDIKMRILEKGKRRWMEEPPWKDADHP